MRSDMGQTYSSPAPHESMQEIEMLTLSQERCGTGKPTPDGFCLARRLQPGIHAFVT
jgi:hypothetical protein